MNEEIVWLMIDDWSTSFPCALSGEDFRYDRFLSVD